MDSSAMTADEKLGAVGNAKQSNPGKLQGTVRPELSRMHMSTFERVIKTDKLWYCSIVVGIIFLCCIQAAEESGATSMEWLVSGQPIQFSMPYGSEVVVSLELVPSLVQCRENGCADHPLFCSC